MILLVSLVVLAWIFRDSLAGLRDEVRSLGPWGIAVFVLALTAWGLTTIPGIPLMVLAGMVYGPWLGALWSLLGATLGATATFWIGRKTAVHKVDRWRDKYNRLDRLLDLVEKHPFVAVLIVRTVAVFPLTLLNYGFGATDLKFRAFIGYSTLVTIPGVAMYSGLGYVFYRGLARQNISPFSIAWVIAFAVLSIAVTIAARRHHARTH